MEQVKIREIPIIPKEGTNIIIGQSHFIKTVEDLYEVIVTASSSIKFGIAFNEASGDRLIRSDGNDKDLIDNSIKIADDIGAGHSFVIVLKNGYPINILNRIKETTEVVNLYVATANSLKVIVYEDGEGDRAILGVIDGKRPIGTEKEEDKEKRHKFLRDIGYKR